jgi:predicted metal-dependent RNase
VVTNKKAEIMETSTYQIEIGEYTGFVLNDFEQGHTVEELIVEPNLADLKQITQEYAFTLNQIPVGYNNLLLQVGDHNVLVDAGIPRPLGHLHSALKELSIDCGEIEAIVITHSDMDHIGIMSYSVV